ncbi:MAG: hypothetical protein ACI8R4_001142 [Paracoccaceae bacterium]|jgi:hypothetical protein
MQDKTIASVLLELPKRIIRSDRQGKDAVEILLTMHGLELPQVYPAHRTDVARTDRSYCRKNARRAAQACLRACQSAFHKMQAKGLCVTRGGCGWPHRARLRAGWVFVAGFRISVDRLAGSNHSRPPFAYLQEDSSSEVICIRSMDGKTHLSTAISPSAFPSAVQTAWFALSLDY